LQLYFPQFTNSSVTYCYKHFKPYDSMIWYMVIGGTGTNIETDNDDDVALTNKNIGIVFHRYSYVIFIMEFI